MKVLLPLVLTGAASVLGSVTLSAVSDGICSQVSVEDDHVAAVKSAEEGLSEGTCADRSYTLHEGNDSIFLANADINVELFSIPNDESDAIPNLEAKAGKRGKKGAKKRGGSSKHKKEKTPKCLQPTSGDKKGTIEAHRLIVGEDGESKCYESNMVQCWFDTLLKNSVPVKKGLCATANNKDTKFEYQESTKLVGIQGLGGGDLDVKIYTNSIKSKSKGKGGDSNSKQPKKLTATAGASDELKSV